MAELVAKAEAIAREAGALLREYFHRGVHTEYKGDVDIVTEADRASEKLITERLRAAFPEHGVYGEEGTRSGLEREYRWYIDPLAKHRSVPTIDLRGPARADAPRTNDRVRAEP